MKPQYKLWTLRSMELPDWWAHRCVGRVLSPDPQGEGAGTLCPDSAPLSLRLAGPDLYPAQENCNFKCSKLLNLKGSRETTNLWPVGQTRRRPGDLQACSSCLKWVPSIWGLCHHTCGVHTNSGGLGQNLIVSEKRSFGNVLNPKKAWKSYPGTTEEIHPLYKLPSYHTPLILSCILKQQPLSFLEPESFYTWATGEGEKKGKGKGRRVFPDIQSLSVVLSQLTLSCPSIFRPLSRHPWASLVGQSVRIHLQVSRPRFDPWVWKDPLENKTATHSSILAWESSWTEGPGGLQSIGSQDLDTTWQLNHHHHLSTSTSHQPATTVSSLSLATSFQNDFFISFIN